MKTFIAASIIALELGTSAFAQTTPEAPAAPAPAEAVAPAAAPAPSTPQFKAASPVVEQAAVAPANYQSCGKNVRDECSNAASKGHHGAARHHRMTAHHARHGHRV